MAVLCIVYSHRYNTLHSVCAFDLIMLAKMSSGCVLFLIYFFFVYFYRHTTLLGVHPWPGLTMWKCCPGEKLFGTLTVDNIRIYEYTTIATIDRPIAFESLRLICSKTLHNDDDDGIKRTMDIENC